MTLNTTRPQRRQLVRDNAKYPLVLEEVPRAEWPKAATSNARLRVWRSRNFLVQEFIAEPPALVRLSIMRSIATKDDWVDGITWDELQNIKLECGYGFHDAVEVYPNALDVVNVANMRHLWIMEKNALLPFAWRRTDGERR